MTDDQTVEPEEIETQDGELLPQREVMSVLTPLPDGSPEDVFPSEPGIGDPMD